MLCILHVGLSRDSIYQMYPNVSFISARAIWWSCVLVFCGRPYTSKHDCSSTQISQCLFIFPGSWLEYSISRLVSPGRCQLGLQQGRQVVSCWHIFSKWREGILRVATLPSKYFLPFESMDAAARCNAAKSLPCRLCTWSWNALTIQMTHKDTMWLDVESDRLAVESDVELLKLNETWNQTCSSMLWRRSFSPFLLAGEVCKKDVGRALVCERDVLLPQVFLCFCNSIYVKSGFLVQLFKSTWHQIGCFYQCYRHVPRRQHCVCSVSGPLRSQLLHPSCKHTTWCATTGCWCYRRTAKCFQRRSWVCWILEPNCHWRCPWTAGRCGHHPTSLGSRLGERRGRVPGQLHRLPCWWQQQHRGREEVEEGCPGDLRQVRCGCYHYSSHQRQRLHACLRRQAGPRWHWGAHVAFRILRCWAVGPLFN